MKTSPHCGPRCCRHNVLLLNSLTSCWQQRCLAWQHETAALDCPPIVPSQLRDSMHGPSPEDHVEGIQVHTATTLLLLRRSNAWACLTRCPRLELCCCQQSVWTLLLPTVGWGVQFFGQCRGCPWRSPPRSWRYGTMASLAGVRVS